MAEGAFANAFSQGKGLMLASKNSSSINSFVVQNHAYLVVGYDAATKQYLLYNPWGWNAGNTDPTYIRETWAQIRHDFSYWTSATA
jgi:uncharacterized protein YvpB